MKLSIVAAELVRVEGAMARQEGEPRKANPYPPGSDARRQWAAGWQSAAEADSPAWSKAQPASRVRRTKQQHIEG
jgi:hypothetical protein